MQMYGSTYRFVVDLKCHLANGETQMIRRLEVPIEAYSQDQASEHLLFIATELVHDRGSNLLDAPLDYLEITASSLAG